MKYLKTFNESKDLTKIAIKQLRNLLSKYGCVEDFSDDSESLGIDLDTVGFNIGTYKGQFIDKITPSKIFLEDGTEYPITVLSAKKINSVISKIEKELTNQ